MKFGHSVQWYSFFILLKYCVIRTIQNKVRADFLNAIRLFFSNVRRKVETASAAESPQLVNEQ